MERESFWKRLKKWREKNEKKREKSRNLLSRQLFLTTFIKNPSFQLFFTVLTRNHFFLNPFILAFLHRQDHLRSHPIRRPHSDVLFSDIVLNRLYHVRSRTNTVFHDDTNRIFNEMTVVQLHRVEKRKKACS